MKISELNPGQGNVDVTVEVISIDAPREFEKFGKKLKVSNAIVKDDSGEIKLTLWNEQSENIKPGMVLALKKAYVSEFKGEKQLTPGKFGSIQIL